MDLPHDDDAIWRALAHPLRRTVLDVLRAGPRTTGALVAALGENRHTVLQHLAVLRDADLVIVEPQGRHRVNHLNPVPIQRIYERWVSHYEAHWAAALVGLADSVELRQRATPEDEGRDVG